MLRLEIEKVIAEKYPAYLDEIGRPPAAVPSTA
jgi:hypothetical protein